MARLQGGSRQAGAPRPCLLLPARLPRAAAAAAAAPLPPVRQPLLERRLLLGRDGAVVGSDVAVHVPSCGGHHLCVGREQGAAE